MPILENHTHQLEEVTTKLSALFSSIPDLIWMKDEAGIYLCCNAAYEDFLGVKENELIGKSDYDFYNHESADFCRQSDAEAISEKRLIITEEMVIYPKDNTLGIMEIRKAPIYHQDGRLMGTLGIARDITERKQMESNLIQREQEFRSLAENAKDPIYRYDRNCRRTYVNPAVERLSGKPSSILLGKTPAETTLVPSEDVVKVMKSLEKVLRSGEPDEIEVKFVNDEGYEYYFQHSHVPEFGMDGRIEGILAIGRDITVQKQLQKDLNAREEMFRTLAENSPNIIMRYDHECHRIYANPAYSEQTGIPLDVALNALPQSQWGVYINMLSMSAEEYQERIKSVIASGEDDHFTVEWYRMNDGGHVIHDLHLVAERDDTGAIIGALAIGHNITKRSMIEKQIEHMAHHDALTGLPNRVLAQDRMEQTITSAKRHENKAALIFIDLDGFKTINDSLGHSVGDAMLQSVASRLKECIRESDTLSRQGGDEFLLILPDINDKEDVIAIADKLIHAFEQPFALQNHLLSASASIGIAIYPDHGDSFESLLKSSDTAMYKAKESGKNTYRCFTRAMNQNITGQFKILSDLKSALKNNEFILHYQPQIDLSTNTITGVEALIRWNHPHLGMIPPMSFIPIAEESGLIVPIGEWVIEEACRQAAYWHSNGITINVAVNTSAMQFKRGNLEIVVKNALKLSGLNPRFFELELTESTMMHNIESTLQSVQSLKALGIQLSIDDFGTGYSSLAYLKRFAVDKLKIDQSFIRDLMQDQEDVVIVSTIIQMAKNLNLKTIAEGVENQEVLNILQRFKCDEVQGYHFAKPLEASEFEHFHTHFNNGYKE
ncbi:sensor domain-containing protein [Sulfuricurvum sp.]|uniref:sensor domain-containing protein n=1 Tax=Sulfuricurvum sp. TaxID=2025608 RepID=UPI002E3004A2|nr:EAL domain-containing protein [Sulfuricurvum sp.]HEX5329120.1 EAL domain-containing protein [Sulfuricurvum sp.]